MKAAILCNGINWTINKITLYMYIYIYIYIHTYISVITKDDQGCVGIHNNYVYIYIYEPECNKPCGKHRCKVCKHINTATNVVINHKKVKPCNHNCDSANVVYLIHCQKCPEALYIGETGGSFRYRFNNHTHSIRQKKFLPLPLHFNADDHNINDLKVCILKGNFKDTKHRKLTELQFIINFETNRFGFNRDISFLSKYDTFKH